MAKTHAVNHIEKENKTLRCVKTLKNYLVVLKVVGETLFVYGFLGWMYGVIVQLTHPYWLSLGLSQLTPWIRVDTFAVLSFITSIAGFFTSRICRHLISRPNHLKST